MTPPTTLGFVFSLMCLLIGLALALGLILVLASVFGIGLALFLDVVPYRRAELGARATYCNLLMD